MLAKLVVAVVVVPRRELDFGGCRCQAFALTGDASATDPVCHLAPHRAQVAELAALRTDAPYIYRRMSPRHQASIPDSNCTWGATRGRTSEATKRSR